MNSSKDKILVDSQIQKLIVEKGYASAADYLHSLQLNSWQLLKNNCDALNNIQTKLFRIDGMKFNVQFNPERIKSTSANVDASSISERKCFLCMENLPEEQKGILISNNFILLCNPYPIFQQHFTIASLDHKPQQISESFSEFLEISKLLSPKYTLIYNGPECGASAPDHLHFQAGSRQSIPIEDDIQQMKNELGKVIQENEFVTSTSINDGFRSVLFIESFHQFLLEKSFKKIITEYASLSSAEHEPLLNLLCTYDNEFGWNLIVILRSKHRPECFYKNDPEKILISPAAVDMGGLIITPREVDFNIVNRELIQNIFKEVSLDQKIFSLLVEKIKSGLI